MPPPPPPAELGGSQISSLLEALPGIASVLRSPVADALVRAIRAAAGVGEFTLDDAEELVRYAVRRGLIGPDEGDRVLADVEGPLKAKGGRRPAHPTKQRGAVAGAAAKRKAAKKKSRRWVARPGTRGPTRAAFSPPGAALPRPPPSPGGRRPAAGSPPGPAGRAPRARARGRP